MNERGITRRSLLLASAGALAGGLTRPGRALAARLGRGLPAALAEPRIFQAVVGTLPAAGGGVTVDLPRNADLVGVQWSGSAQARVQVRFREARGTWSRWASGATHGHAPDEPPRHGVSIGDPIWTGGSSLVQLRADRPLSGVRLSCVDVSAGIGARRALAAAPAALAAALPLATPVLAAGSGQPPILARQAWAQGMAKPRVAPQYGAVRMAFVHHTENPNGYSPEEVPAMLRAIFVYHRYVRGWNDIGYNFVIDLYGRIFEARAGGIDEPVVGAQAGGYNMVSTGVAVLGDFMSSSISGAAASALERLLAWKLSLHGTPTAGRVTVEVDPAGAFYSRFPAGAHVSLPRVAGHRDGDSTDCPGDVLYGELPALRRRIDRLAGRPALATIALSASGASPGGQVSAPAGQAAPGGQSPPDGEGSAGGGAAQGGQGAQALTGSLAFLDGTPIAGAPILIQARSVTKNGEVVQERTVGRAVTAAQGQWSLALASSPSAHATWLRVLCPGTNGLGASDLPATVSQALALTGAVIAAEASPPTPSAAGSRAT